MGSRAATGLAAILIVALGWGCGGSGPSSPSNSSSSSSSGNSGGSSSCNWVGTWVSSSGANVTSRSDGSQTTLVANPAPLVGVTSFSQSWSISGTTYSVTDRSSSGVMGACPSGQVGTYTITFSNSCNTVQFTHLSDACDGRRPFIAGTTATRQ